MNNNGGFSSNILVLDRKNWDRWSALMKSLFGAQEVRDLAQNGYEDLKANPTEAQRLAFREAKKKDCKTLFYIQQNVKQVKLQSLRRKYEMIQMKEDQRIVVIQEAKDVKTMKIEEMQSSLEAHELMVIDRGAERSVQQALQAQTAKKEGNYKNSKKKGKSKANWSNNGKTKTDEKHRHFANECWFKKDQQNDEEAIVAQEWLTSFDSSKKTSIKLADSRKLVAEGQLVEKGFSMTMDGDSLKLLYAKKNLVLKSNLSKNRTYKKRQISGYVSPILRFQLQLQRAILRLRSLSFFSHMKNHGKNQISQEETS
ncbi:retrovirus-related pol polyprotein from transposon TNT 1-94, partial [Trifolium medium]|nr:retrovirus-related pol polyprotein from transposon TNT 1-94 [Trifolium medium]